MDFRKKFSELMTSINKEAKTEGRTLADWEWRLTMRQDRLRRLVELKAPTEIISREKELIKTAEAMVEKLKSLH